MTALASVAPRVATFHHVPADPDRAKDYRAQLDAFANGFGPILIRYDVQAGAFEQKIRTLLARAETGAFDLLCVFAIGALGMSRMGALKIAQKLDAMGVTVQSFSEPWFDAKAPWVEWVIEGERRVLERSQTALAKKRANNFVTGTVPLGFARGENGELVRDEYEQTAIARAKELAPGRSLGLVAQIMTEEGYETRAGTPITHTWVRRALTSGATLDEGTTRALT